MLILLPPSETKRDGGSAATLELDTLSFDALTPQRVAAVAALTELVEDPDAAMKALKLGRTQGGEVERNRRLAESPVMPAIDRYTGVLYDALDAPSLDSAAREFAHRHVVIHSALFGPVRALDPIPAYRLSHDSRLPGLVLRRHWREAAASAIAAASSFVIDLRSVGYVGLGPAPDHGVYVRVVAEAADGRRAALNHFNKKAKGEFARALTQAGIVHRDADSLLRWAARSGLRLERGAEGEGELDLIV